MANRIKMGPMKRTMMGPIGEVDEYKMQPIVPNSANAPSMQMHSMPMKPDQMKRMQNRSLGMMPSLGDPMEDYNTY